MSEETKQENADARLLALWADCPVSLAKTETVEQHGKKAFKFTPYAEIAARLRPIFVKHGFYWQFAHSSGDAEETGLSLVVTDSVCGVRYTSEAKTKLNYNPKFMSAYQGHFSFSAYCRRNLLLDFVGTATGDEPDRYEHPQQPLQPATLPEIQSILDTTSPETWPQDRGTVRQLLARMPASEDKDKAIAMANKTRQNMAPTNKELGE